MTHTKTLTDLIQPWLESLVLPGGSLHTSGFHDKTLRGVSHWYTYVRPDADVDRRACREDWVLTVRGDHVEIRDNDDDSPTAISWHTIEAADPNFFVKLESDLRAALECLARS